MNSKNGPLVTTITLALAVAILHLSHSSARGQGELGAFGARPSYNNVPDLTNPGASASHIVFYSLPSPQTSTSIYAGPSGGFFDILARVSGDGTFGATGLGLQAFLDGNGEIVFDPAPIAGGPSPPNNVPYSLNPSFARNSSLDIMYGVKNVAGAGSQSFGLIALNDAPGANVTITDGDGLAAVRVSIAGGAAGMFHVNFGDNPATTGFTNAAGQVVTNPAVFPHATGLIEVRRSVPGDMNGDGAANQADSALFLSAIADPGAFKQLYPWLQTDYIADFNEDRLINGDDLAGFQQAVVPEPATVGIAIVAALVAVVARRGRRTSTTV
jgi:hypothetical protein